MSVSSVLVLGGGVTGSVLSLALAQRGVQVDLAEISPVWHGVGHGITIQGNALLALQKVGVAGQVIAAGFPFSHMRLLHADGSVLADLPTPQTGGSDLPPTIGSLRASMQEVLCKAVYGAGVCVRLGLTIEHLSLAPEHVDVVFSDGTKGRYDLVVGADGIHSHLRGLLGIAVRPRSAGMTIWRIVAPRPEQLQCAEVYYGGPRYKAGYSPISAGQCYAYLLDEDMDPGAFDGRPLGAVLRERSAGYGGRWGQIREGIADDAAVDFRRIEHLLVDDPWHRGRAIIIGDAAHTCPPLIAQGAAMCAEDAVVLAELVTADEAVPDALAEFMRRRYPRVRMVVRNSLQLADWETHPGTPGADPGRVMSETLTALLAPA
jgi:2-polyprenyl-6-methoxyphenol hydroxylase-like FAD-dependent oxidoreductase